MISITQSTTPQSSTSARVDLPAGTRVEQLTLQQLCSETRGSSAKL
jgi:hypothetical protein